MHHLAILSKEKKLLAKIISGEKTIESRWYKFRKTPYENIAPGDTIYFKESGDPITAKAEVAKALFFSGLTPEKIRQLLEEYGKQIGISKTYAKKLQGKNFCALIFLRNVERVKPFGIDKKGFGMMAAWITVKDIKSIKRSMQGSQS